MWSMFKTARSFNQTLNKWNVSNVTNMNWMFQDATFNQPLNNWNVSKSQQTDCLTRITRQSARVCHATRLRAKRGTPRPRYNAKAPVQAVDVSCIDITQVRVFQPKTVSLFFLLP